jgi:hypothetical protein
VEDWDFMSWCSAALFFGLKENTMQKKNSHRDLAATINVRLPASDLENIKTISTKLDLEASEIARRALKEGLKLFRDARLPGSEAD